MKTAIICDWLMTIGGAEKVLAELLTCFPNADLFAVMDFLPAGERTLLQNRPVKTTFIQTLPFAKHFYRHLLPLMPLAIEQLDLSAYHLIFSSSHAVAKGVLTGPDQLHISYVHSPMRYAWDLQHQYFRETGLDKKWHGWFARYFLHKLRLWDLRSAQGVDYFMTNSAYIARRIQKTYRRSAEVIPPPIDTIRFTPHAHKGETYVTASRLVPYKKIDMIVESFSSMPDKKLIVIGDGPDFAKIKSKAGPNVTLLGRQSDEILVYYLQRAKAFVFAAEEDFGILPLEAQACGTPVIAYNKGGTAETIIDLHQPNPSGVLFEEQTIMALKNAIARFETNSSLIKIENCIHNAAKYNAASFRERLQSSVTDVCKNWSKKSMADLY